MKHCIPFIFQGEKGHLNIYTNQVILNHKIYNTITDVVKLYKEMKF